MASQALTNAGPEGLEFAGEMTSLSMSEVSLTRWSGIGFASRSLALAVTFGTNLWLAHELGPSGYGQFVLAVFVSGLIALGANVGMGSAVSYFVARRPRDARKVTVMGFVASALTLAIVLPIAWLLFTVAAPGLLPGLGPGWIAAAIAVVPLRLAQENFVGACIGLGLLGRMFAQSAVPAYLFLVALVTTLTAAPLDASVVAAAWLMSNLGATLVGAALTLPALVVRTGEGGSDSPTPGGRDLVIVGAQQSLNLGAWWLLARVSRAILDVVVGTAAVGRFAVSLSISEVVLQIPATVQVSAFSQLVGGEDKDSVMHLQRLTRMATIVVALASVIAMAVAAIFIVNILGPSYGEAVPAMAALIPGMIGLAPVMPIGGYFLARFGEPRLNLIPSALALTVLIPSVWLLAGVWGLVGAGLGTSAANVVAGVSAVALFSWRTGEPWTSTVIPRVEDVRLLMRLVAGGR